MTFKSMLLKLQIKRALKLIPKLIIGAAMIIIVVVGIVFFGAKNSNEKIIINKSKIAVVSDGNTFIEDVVLEVLDGMESINTIFEFVETDKEEAFKLLDSGEIIAFAVFPEDYIDGISRGDNIPAEIYLKGDSNSFGISMVAELCDAFRIILTANESATYAMNDLLVSKGYESIRRQYDDQLDLYSFKMLFERNDNFLQVNLVGQSDSTIAQGYVAAGMVLLILLLGMSCGSLFNNEPRAFEEKLREVKIGHFRQLMYKLIALLLLLVSIYLVVGLIVFAFFGTANEALAEINIFDRLGLAYLLLGFVPCIIFAASFTMFAFTFADNQIGGILFLFSVTIVCGYISGLLYPSSYLPKTVLGFQRYLPTTYMHKQATQAMNGQFDLSNAMVILGFSLVFYLLSVIIMKNRSKRA